MKLNIDLIRKIVPFAIMGFLATFPIVLFYQTIPFIPPLGHSSIVQMNENNISYEIETNTSGFKFIRFTHSGNRYYSPCYQEHSILCDQNKEDVITVHDIAFLKPFNHSRKVLIIGSVVELTHQNNQMIRKNINLNKDRQRSFSQYEKVEAFIIFFIFSCSALFLLIYFFILELSNQVQRFFEVNFIRCFPT